jgi:3-oxosteroid 1-dehydrogenase
VRLGHRVTEVVVRAGRAVGVRATTEAGEAVELEGAVVLATSSFDHDPELVEEFWGLREAVSMAPRNIAGDGVRLARAAGADIVPMEPQYAPVYPGYRLDGGSGFTMAMEFPMPHTFIVDRHARRFVDDSLPWRLVRAALDPDGDHLPIYMIWDERHHQRYGLGATSAGEPYPEDLVTSAPTLRELGERLGIDGAVLEETAERFNSAAAEGADPDFGRGTSHYARTLSGDPNHPIHPNVAPVDQAPFFGMPLVLGGAAVGLAGIRIDADAHALDEAGNVIPGLYAVGSAAAYTSSGISYNSGYSLSRAVTHGYLVGADLAGRAN